MALTFLIAAAAWVLVWVVLLVLGLVNLIFRPLLDDGTHDKDPDR
jgi:hypothetical protein